MKNEAKSQAVFAVSYVRNVRGRAMLPESTVNRHPKDGRVTVNPSAGVRFYLSLTSLGYLTNLMSPSEVKT